MVGPVPKMSEFLTEFRHAENPDIYYGALMKLATISACVQNQLYSLRRKKKHSNQREETMSYLEALLHKWKSRLPRDLDFELDVTNSNPTYIRHVSTA